MHRPAGNQTRLGYFDGRGPHGMLDTGALYAAAKVVPHLAAIVARELAAQEGGDIFGLDRLNEPSYVGMLELRRDTSLVGGGPFGDRPASIRQECTTYSLSPDLKNLLEACNRRYLALYVLPAIGRAIEGRQRLHTDLERVNLSGADLYKADLSRAELFEAKLTRTRLARANLSGAMLNEADLSGAMLNGADLSKTQLYAATLKGASIALADLIGTDLGAADLSGANLIRADLREANLDEADLSGANLLQADLSGVNLIGVNLLQADLTGANLTNAKVTRAQLETAKNWEQAIGLDQIIEE